MTGLTPLVGAIVLVVFGGVFAAIDAAIKSPELRARLIPQGIDPVGGTRAEFVKFINAEKARLAPIAKASNMRED